MSNNNVASYSYYDIGGNVVSSTDALGHTIQTTTFSNNGQFTSGTAGANSASATYYNDLTTHIVTGSNADQTVFGYAAETYRPSQVTNPDNSITKYSYSDLNQYGQTIFWTYPYRTTVTSPMGKITHTVLDGFGRTIQVSVKESSTNWLTTLTQYSACACSATGKAVSTSRPFDSGTDANGNPMNTPISGQPYWTTTTNDGLGRPVTVTLPYTGTTSGPAQTSYSYSTGTDTLTGASGTLTTVTDPNGKLKRYFYDAFGELIRVEELATSATPPFTVNNLTETARYTYDAVGHMTLVQMGRNGSSFTQTRTFTYSPYSSSAPFGLLASATTPEKGTVNYYYNSLGLLDHKTDAKSQTLWYAYDPNHRLLSVSYGSSQSSATTATSFTYDTATNGVGKLATAANCDTTLGCTSSNSYTWSYSYDVLGNVTGQTLNTPFTAQNAYFNFSSPVNPGASYTYDSDRKLTAMTAPGTQVMGQSSFSWTAGPSYQYAYDTAGRPTGMNQWDPVNQVWNTVTSNGTFNAAGQMTGWQEYGYYNLNRTYDSARGWLTALTASNHVNLQYSYNSGGQATQVTDNINPGQSPTSYTYDNLDRLASASAGPVGNLTWTMAYTYDNFGNRLTQTGTGTASSLTQTLGYDGTSNHITSISTYFYGIGYDANGNASQIPGTNGQYSYLSLAYDVFDRVIHESGNYMGAGPSTAYDAFGRRIAKNLTDGTTRIYFYDPAGREIAEYNFNPNATCNYSGTYYTCTALGSPTATYTYFAGQRVGQWTDRVGSRRYTPVGSTASSYYPYGEDVTGNPTNNDTFKFAQTYRDSDSGLDYAMNRYYASGIGRFVTTDPMAGHFSSPQSLNLYAYVVNDPTNQTDPDGLCPQGYVEATSQYDIALITNTVASYVNEGIGYSYGSHYQLNGNGSLNAIDCSGLVSQALAGIEYAGSSSTFESASSMFQTSNFSTDPSSLFAVDASRPQAGDIILTAGHVTVATAVTAAGVTFVGSQTSTGPAEVDTSASDPNSQYWKGQLAGATYFKPCIPAALHKDDPPVAGGGGSSPKGSSKVGGAGTPWWVWAMWFLNATPIPEW